ncbi:hypothetical protein LCGC14_2510040 [marine sediment metagenome]|uniref:Uncharacterized protein n=1 Tax=marine sediment metagenome TaxID=412755 RepID=A0A0F9DB65_9ZZZZ
MYPKWRKVTNCRLPYWKLKVGHFIAEVLDETPDGGEYPGYVYLSNSRTGFTIWCAQKVQRTARQAKVVALLSIRRECTAVLELTDHMDTRYY